MSHILCLLLIIPLTYGFIFPVNVSSDIVLYSNITSTNTCSNGTGVSCNSTCPARTSFPKFVLPLANIPADCNKTVATSPPPAADTSNGNVSFEWSDNCTVTQGYPLSSQKPYFTLSLWMNIQCSSKCSIGSIGNVVTLEYSGTSTRTFTVKTGTGQDVNTTLSGGWNSVVIRYNGQITCYVNGLLIGGPKSLTFQTTVSLKLGPNSTLTNSDKIQMLDARWYEDALTDREIVYVYNKSFASLPLQSECRCPALYPELVKDTYPTQYMKCRNATTAVTVMRLRPEAHLPEYIIDNDTSTYWIWNNASSVTMTVELDKVQLKSITLDGVSTKPDKIFIELYTGSNKRNSLTFEASCNTSGGACLTMGTLPRFSYDLESNITRRDDYEKILADRIVITFSASTQKQFSLSDLKLEARCACYGNDETCKIFRGNYSCRCDPDTNTTGEFCQMCIPGRYLNTTEEAGGFQCDNSCHCDSTGSFNNACESINGQCHCKADIAGRQCDSCVNNATDLSSTGCRKDDTCYGVNETCACRSGLQGRICEICKDGYFNLRLSNTVEGCEDCLCNLDGSNGLTCNKTSGQCRCYDGTSPNRNCEPIISEVDPAYGPDAGGTEITLTGQLLERAASVKIDDVSQNITLRNSTVILIQTSSSKTERKAKSISIVWNSGNKTLVSGKYFQYKVDPQVVLENSVKSYASGGCSISVTGGNLYSVKYPKMLTYVNIAEKPGIIVVPTGCFDVTDRHMNCKTPNISEYGTNKTWKYGVKMDGITVTGSFEITVVPDPTVDIGQRMIFRNTFDKIFPIKGTRLKDACNDDDAMILLGDKPCNGLKREDNQLSCEPGESFPGTTRTVIVKVKIGNIEVEWGTLEFKSFWALNEFIYIVVGFSGFVIIITVVVIVCCCVRRGKCRSQTIKKDQALELENLTSDPSHRRRTNDYQFTNPMAVNQVAVIQPMEKQRSSKEISEDFCNRLNKSVKKIVNTSLIEKSNIDAGHLCTHKGKLIRVINGQYNSSSSSPYSGMALTIKTLLNPYPEEGNMPDWLNDGLMECTRLRDFTNDNVLRMTGIAVDPKNIYIIYPEMANRTLKDYISRADQELNGEKKLEICVQVAEGMNYLSSQSIVHKDLATRNCWVSRKSEIKIGDSSFSYDLYPEDYLNNNGRYQPVRWMAPECLRQGFYDTKSDVWAYGVLLWEIYTDGYKPYHDIADDRDVQQKVCDEGYRLGKPHECPDKVFELIEECQIQKGADRPNFFIIQNRLDSIVHPGKGLPVSYMNDMELYTNTKDTAAAHVVPDGSNIDPSTQDMEDYENVTQMEVYENLKFKPAS